MARAEESPLAARWVAAWAGWAGRRPWAAIALLAVLAGISVLGALRLSVDTDSSKMLDPRLGFQMRAQEIARAFPDTKNTIVVAVRSPRADAADAALRRLVAALEGEPGIARVFAPAVDPFFARAGLLYLETDALEARLTQLSKSANLLAALREDQTLEGFLGAVGAARRLAERADLGAEALERLYGEAAAVIEAAADGRPRSFAWASVFAGEGPVLRLLTVTPALDFRALNPARAAERAVRGAIAGLPEAIAAEVEIGVTGDPVLRAEELRSVTATLGVSLALSIAFVGFVLWLALGTLGRMALALGALALTLVLTTGAAAFAVGALNLVSVAFVVLMVGLGIDFAIHYLSHIAEDAKSMPPDRAVVASAAALGPALALTAATTALAFLAFTTTAFEGMAQLGLIGGIGALLAFAVAVTLIPAVLALRPGLAEGRGRLKGLRMRDPGRWGAGLALALGLGSAALLPGARFDADPMALRNPAAPAVSVAGWLAADPGRGLLRLSLLADTPEAAAEAAGRIAALPEVRGTVWLRDLVPQHQEAKLALVDLAWPSLDFAVSGSAVELGDADGPPSAGWGESPAAEAFTAALARLREGDAAGRARLEAALFAHFPALIDRLAAQLEVDRVALDDLPAPLRDGYLAADGRYRVEILPAADIQEPAARAAFVEAVRAVEPGAGGPPEQIEAAADTIAGAMVQASLLALAGTAILALAMVRSLAATVAVLLPVALAGTVTAAATVLLGVPFNYANVIVLPLLIGIGVDAGVHLALRDAQAGQVFATATPGAVLASAATTVGAFATLALSDHRGTASMGLLLAIAVTAAVAMAFTLTPATLRRLRPTRRPATPEGD